MIREYVRLSGWRLGLQMLEKGHDSGGLNNTNVPLYEMIFLVCNGQWRS